MILLFCSALAAEPVRFDIADVSPDPGERVWWRLAWTNDSSQPVRIPADLFDRLSVRIQAEITGDPKPHIYSDAWVTVGEEPTQASQLEWLVVPAFSTVERTGDLSAFIPDCKPGCPPGDYKVEIGLVAPPVGGLASDQRLPAPLSWTSTLTVNTAVLPLLDPANLAVTITKVQRDKQEATVDLKIGLQSQVSAWLPGSRARIAECIWRWTQGGSSVVRDERVPSTAGLTWPEADGTVMNPGDSLDLTITCTPPKIPGAARDLRVAVRLRPAGRFLPKAATSTPFWLAAEFVSEPAPVSK